MNFIPINWCCDDVPTIREATEKFAEFVRSVDKEYATRKILATAREEIVSEILDAAKKGYVCGSDAPGFDPVESAADPSGCPSFPKNDDWTYFWCIEKNMRPNSFFASIFVD